MARAKSRTSEERMPSWEGGVPQEGKVGSTLGNPLIKEVLTISLDAKNV